MLPWTFRLLPTVTGAQRGRVAGTCCLQGHGPRRMADAAAESLFGNFLFSIFMLYGVSMTSAASAGVILSTLPAVVALFSAGCSCASA